tara:strand:+ start:127 stop:522 length:396 start_codon:yes stop_codon:yes gene_type:complete
MAFKLGKRSGPLMEKGQVKSKASYKDESDISVPGTPIYRKDLEGGVLGESNNDGSIFVHKDVEPGSQQEKEVVAHEMVHQTHMKVGKLAYTDDSITWDGVEYPRKDGYIMYEGEQVEEGSKDFPWEKMPWD